MPRRPSQPRATRTRPVLVAPLVALLAAPIAHAPARAAPSAPLASPPVPTADDILADPALWSYRLADAQALYDEAFADASLTDTVSDPTAPRAAAAARLAHALAAAIDRAPDTPATRPALDALLARAAALTAAHPELDAPALRLELATRALLAAEADAEALRLAVPRPQDAAARAAALTGRLVPVRRALLSLSISAASEADLRATAARRSAQASASAARDALSASSKARYYTAWATLHLAELAPDPAERRAEARDAAQHFAHILDQTDSPPRLDRLAPALLRYEHVARAAAGLCLALALAGDEDAPRWLSALDDEPRLAQAVRDALPTLRVRLAAEGGRWSDLTEELRRLGPLRPVAGEEIAAILLTAAPEDDPRVPAALAAAAEALLRLDRLDLLALLHANDRIPPSAQDSFAARLAKGLDSFDTARALHRDADAALVAPPPPDAAAAYRAALEALLPALAVRTSADLAPARERALFTAALAHAALSDWPRADALLAEIEAGPLAADAAWMRIIAAERAPPGTLPARDAAAQAFLARFPSDRRAAYLLAADRDPRTMDTLRALAPSDALAAARLLAALYTECVEGSAQPCEEAADLADRILSAPPSSPAAAALLARQAADLAFRADPPRPALALRALALADTLPAESLGQAWPSERTLRRLQLAAAAASLDADWPALRASLADAADPYRTAALRLVLEDARARTDAPALERTIDAASLWADAPPAVLDRAAAVAFILWREHQRADMKPRALAFDEALARGGHASATSHLRRAAVLADSARHAEAAAAATSAMRAAATRSDTWYEARLLSIEHLSAADPAAARVALAQFAVLDPQLGGPAHAPRFRALADALQLTLDPAAP